MKLWNWMPYVDEDGYCQVNRPAVHLKKEEQKDNLGFGTGHTQMRMFNWLRIQQAAGE